MNRGVVFSALIFLPVFLVAVVLFTPSEAGAIEVRRDKKIELREDVKNKAASRSAQVKQKNVQRLKVVFSKILERYTAALNRLNKIVEKLNNRIVRLEAEGVDTSAAEAKLADCAIKKVAAETAISDAKNKIAAVDPSSSTVRETVKTSLSALRAAKESIRAYHKCLIEVTRMLKSTAHGVLKDEK